MTPARLAALAARLPALRVAVVGDFCLDRYLEIDPARAEASIETGLPVHNVLRVRSQPGGAGTILNNLAALGVGRIHPVGFCGDDGEGYELLRALRALPGVEIGNFLQTNQRRTFTYCKPLLLTPGQPPQELSRLDSKNWDTTPAHITDELLSRLRALAPQCDALIVLDQVDLPETGVLTTRMRAGLGEIAAALPGKTILADSRRGLRGWPAVDFKMNRAELAAFTGAAEMPSLDEVRRLAGELALRHRRRVFVTLAEHGLIGAGPDGATAQFPALPVRGPIDIVGAGDAVTANLATALAAGGSLDEALRLANAAASVVIHQLGTTGTASVGEITARLRDAAA
jgi:rfaE bifunctional protein kinase chain/domain